MNQPPSAPRSRIRWSICALLFCGVTINYIDRQTLGILKPTLSAALGWNELGYAHIVQAFTLAYALGNLFGGAFIDWIGVRIGLPAMVFGWSVAAALTGAMRTVAGFGAARFGLGLFEATKFPAAIKIVSVWFPARERALATGIFNCGTNIGAVVCPFAVAWLVGRGGWPLRLLRHGLPRARLGGRRLVAGFTGRLGSTRG